MPGELAIEATGLDPRSRNQVWEIIRTVIAEGTPSQLTTTVRSGALHVRRYARLR